MAAGVLPAVAVRDVGLLAPAVGRPQASAFGEDAYPTLAEKAAALLHALARTTRSWTATSAWPGLLHASSAC